MSSPPSKWFGKADTKAITLELLDRPQALPDPPLVSPQPDREQTQQQTIGDYVHSYADKIRGGEIMADDFLYLVDAASQIRTYGFDVDGPYVGSDGRPLRTDDAELVMAGSSPDAWTVPQDQAEDLRVVQKFFSGKTDELDPSIPFEELDRVGIAREWLGATLRIANPHRFTLDQLAQEIEQRIALSDWLLLEQDGGRVAPQVRVHAIGAALVDGVHRAESVSQIAVLASEPADQVAPRPDYHPVPLQRTRTRAPQDIEPTRPFSGHARSHRSRSERPRRLRKLATLAVVALLGLVLLPSSSPATDPATSTAATDIAPPAPDPVKYNLQPQQEPQQTPVQESLAPHIMSLGGEYNPDTRIGAIWFSVEDYAASLGAGHLTLLQIHMLTQRTLDYMNKDLQGGGKRVAGGMDWSKAQHLPSDAALPYPPAQVMRQWVGEVIAQTG